MLYRLLPFKSPTLLLVACIIAGIGDQHTVNAQSAPPASVAELYETERDQTISSDFADPAEIGQKFTYRSTNGARGSSDNTLIEDGELQVLGIKGTANGGGLTHLHQSQYGFYSVRFKITGLTVGKSTAWHPSIWSTHTNQGAGKLGRNLADKSRTLDINWMELWNYPTWNTSMIDKKEGKRIALYAHDLDNNSGFGQWNEWGLEYHPNYLTTWEYHDGKWKRIRKSWFSNNDVTIKTRISKAARSPMYWQLSNKYHYPEGSDDDVNLYVDYFHHYKLKQK